MELRQQRGLELAATKKIQAKDGVWVVPSQAGTGSYKVNMDMGLPTCSCPDFETRGLTCKHIFAVSFVITRERQSDGSTIIRKTVEVAEVHRATYAQDWPAYNAAQMTEKDTFQTLLHSLCSGIPQPETKKVGRPTLPLSDAIFSTTFKVYSTVSGRRFMGDLWEAKRRGHISKAPHYNSIFNYLESPDLTPILRELIVQSSLPLKAVETSFAADSSGFSTSRFIRWYDIRYGKERIEHEWVKCHVMCGVKTNIITAVEIGNKFANDIPFFPPMVEATARNFQISEVSADKGYGSIKNAQAVMNVGGTPFIAFKPNATGAAGGAWEQMFHYFMYRRTEFMTHYHKRSNIESTFSMMKRKFGDSLRSKTDTAMVNETLCKVLCHNLVVLIHEMYELGISPEFWSN